MIDTTLPKLSRPEVDAGLSTAPLGESENFHPALNPPRPSRQLVELMLRVQEFVMQRRIRVSEFLRVSDNTAAGWSTEFHPALSLPSNSYLFIYFIR